MTCRAIIPDRLGLFVARSPFTVDEALQTQYAIIAGDSPGLSLDTPSILDFTDFSVGDLSASELMRFVKVRRTLVEAPTTGPLAFVCGSVALFGMVRMFSMLAEVGGLWQEKMIHVTREAPKGIGWIVERAGLDHAQKKAVAAELKASLGWDYEVPPEL